MGGIVALIAISTAVGLVMEMYKKKIRKDRAKEWEIKLVSYAFSVLGGALGYFVVDTSAVFPGLIESKWLILLFSVFVYLLQLDVCMSFWKPLIKKLLERKLDG